MKPTVLCILDGFGLNPNPKANAVAMARKPCFDKLWSTCPHSTLVTFGERVGLPEGQMGNSEVGHLNIGAGRVVEQWLLRINRALSTDKYLNSSSEYMNWKGSLKQNSTIHIIGLYSDGGVHSHNEHLKLLLTRLRSDIKNHLALHLITDGRDTTVDRSLSQIPELENWLTGCQNVEIASISGRYYAMDRDKRWDRTKLAYDSIALGQAKVSQSALEYLKSSHRDGVTDEFTKPASLTGQGIAPDDAVIFFNFREDRMRQIVAALASPSFEGFTRSNYFKDSKRVLCFTDYDHSLHLAALFPILSIKNHLGEVVSTNNLRQLRTAETEKYPHVTYFFNGGIENQYPGEDRKLVPSPRDVKTYDLKPEMSASGVADIVVDGILSQAYDLIVVNFANCDMVGHTGVLNAAICAVETVDGCLGRIVDALAKVNGKAVVIADHGNADQMIYYENGSPHTTHTMYPVPVVIYGMNFNGDLRPGGSLSDVAPTILKMLGLSKPAEMTGESLF